MTKQKSNEMILKMPGLNESDRSLSKELYRNSEAFLVHTSYQDEIAILSCVRDGDIQRLIDTYYHLPRIVYGRMSADDDKQLFYGSIANTTLVTRYAIEGGMDEEEAFSLSDVYIRKMEKLSDTKLQEMNIQMALDFTRRVQMAKQRKRKYRNETEAAIDYIKSHRHERIHTSDLAAAAGLAPTYFCALFRKETGTTPAAYIRKQKVDEAMHLLRFSDLSYSAIAESLGFSSQSHFTHVFHQIVGMTPGQYREQKTKRHSSR